jgi:hypothetical protein
MASTFAMELERVHSGLGQGSVPQQIDKLYRKQQRLTLFQLLEKVDGRKLDDFPVVLYKHIVQTGKNIRPDCVSSCRFGKAMMRFSGNRSEIT